MFTCAVSCKCSTEIFYPKCGFCGTTDKKLSTCSICKIQNYCSRNCLQADLQKHSFVCLTVSRKIQIQGLEIKLNKEIPKLNEEQEKDADALICLQLVSIIDGGAGQTKCKLMGQELFEKYKSIEEESSAAAGAVLEKICRWISTNCADGPKRSAAISVAWQRIGDDNWIWN